MRVEIKKGRDSRPTLVCVRADGSRTWSRVHPFFPLHDLTHYAVESVLGLTEAFFGLVASGWALEAFADRATRARLPAEAVWAEHVVGLLDLAAVRTLRADRAARWAAVAPGATLELPFPAPGARRAFPSPRGTGTRTAPRTRRSR